MEYREEDFLMLSGIQHFAFCRRQWALIHIEQQWAENVHTVQGNIMHKRAHDVNLTEKTKDVLVVRALPIHSYTLGISGECDVVEFKKADDGVRLNGHRELYQICPVEYKKGKPKSTEIDILQLIAQVMCLEEMFSTHIDEGFLYYGEIRRRENVIVTDELKGRVTDMFKEMHQLYTRGNTPKVKPHKGCSACSLKEICIPKLKKNKKVRTYIDDAITGDV